MDAKLKALIELSQLQTKVGGLFVQAEMAKAAGDYTAAHAIYEEYIVNTRIYLRANLDYNSQFPESSSDILPIVRPLVNALMVDADIVQALGNRAAAEALRQEALEISRKYLGRKGTADTERSRAASLKMEGRFNEAIVALMDARDVILEEANPLALARVTLDLVDILQWLGDFRRAKEEIEHAEALIKPAVGDHQPSQMDVIAGIFSSITSIMAGRGDPGDAVRSAELYRAALEVVYYHGLISKALQEWDEAERCFNQVLPEYQKLASGEGIEYQLAQIKAGRGQFREALEQARRIDPVFDRGAFRPSAVCCSAFRRSVFTRWGTPVRRCSSSMRASPI